MISKLFLRSTLDALSAHIAILDEHGTIIEVNAAWTRFADENGLRGKSCGAGGSYLKICDSAAGSCSEEAPAAARGIRAVMNGQIGEFHLEYPCHSPQEQRWFSMRATRFAGEGPIRVVLAHETITARKKLEEKLGKLSCAVEQNAESIMITDLQGVIDYVNPKFCAVTGYCVEEVLGKNSRMLSSGLVQPEVYRKMWATLIGGKEWYGEFHNRKKNGDLFWEAASISGIRDDTGKVTRFVAVKEDITERKRIEVALRESEERFRALFNRSLDCVFVHDFEGRFLDANPAAFALLGYERNELASLTFNSLLIPEHLSRAVYMSEQLRTVGTQTKPSVYTLRCKDGRLVEVETNASLVMRDGRPHSILGIARDITERGKASQALRESEERFSAAFEFAPIGVALVTPDGRWIKVNRALCDLVGHSEAEMLVSTFQDITLAGDLAGNLDDIRRLLAGKISTCQMEKRFVHARGNLINVLIDVSLIRDRQGRPRHLIVQVQDITERKRAAQKLAEHEEREARARRELEHERELAKVKSRFVSIVSHEFRTPLAVINAAAHLLGHYADRMSGEERLGQVEEIQNAVGRMAEMMEDLLVHGNLQSGNMKCTVSRVAIEEFCRRLISETSNHPFAQCAIELDVGSSAHEAFLDEKLLRCILGNLLSNAVKYSLPGQPVVLEIQRVAGNLAIDADSRTSAGEHLQFKISDSGIGIPAADLSKVFQPFHRASNTGNRSGTGMGLAIVKQSVELHRGSIKVESEEGKGTTFWVWLPLALPNLAEGSPVLPAEPNLPVSGEQ